MNHHTFIDDADDDAGAAFFPCQDSIGRNKNLLNRWLVILCLGRLRQFPRAIFLYQPVEIVVINHDYPLRIIMDYHILYTMIKHQVLFINHYWMQEELCYVNQYFLPKTVLRTVTSNISGVFGDHSMQQCN